MFHIRYFKTFTEVLIIFVDFIVTKVLRFIQGWLLDTFYNAAFLWHLPSKDNLIKYCQVEVMPPAYFFCFCFYQSPFLFGDYHFRHKSLRTSLF